MMNVYKNVNENEKALELFDHFRNNNRRLHSGCFAIALYCCIKSMCYIYCNYINSNDIELWI